MTRPAVSAEPSVLRTRAWADYALMDSGDGRKLERYGPVTVVRPEPQCLWRPALDPQAWDRADAVFDPSDEEDAGRWRTSRPLPDRWPLAWGEARMHARLTAFRHLAFFPEQAANWAWLDERVRALAARTSASGATEPPRILNLFGYTGVASLVCAAAGSAVTHVDASKRAIGWARENAVLCGLDQRPIRWICEDARRFVAREARRGSRYHAIILDPPKYGRGPENEVWRLLDDLPGLARLCAELLAEEADFLLLNAYAERISGLSLSHMLADVLEGRGGVVDWGELALVEEAAGREIGLSFFARWRGGP